MDKLIFNGEGWPLTQESLQQIEEAYTQPIIGLTRAFGDNLILTGLEDDGNGGLTGGYIVFNQELLPFEAGVEQANAVVVEETVQANYDNDGDGSFGDQAAVWKKRYAKFAASGSGVADIDFSTLERYKAGLLKSGEIVLTFDTNNTYTASGDISSVSSTGDATLAYTLTFNVIFNEPLDSDEYIVHMNQVRNAAGGHPMSTIVYEKRLDGFKFTLFRALAYTNDIELSSLSTTEKFDVSVMRK